MYHVNAASAWKPCAQSPSPVAGEFSCQENTFPLSANMIPPVPVMFEYENNNSSIGYFEQYLNDQSYCKKIYEPPHHSDYLNTTCFFYYTTPLIVDNFQYKNSYDDVSWNSQNYLFNQGKLLPYIVAKHQQQYKNDEIEYFYPDYITPLACNYLYNSIDNYHFQYEFTHYESYLSLYLINNCCDCDDCWNGQNKEQLKTSNKKKKSKKLKQINKKLEEEHECAVLLQQLEKSENLEVENYFNQIKQNNSGHSDNSSIPAEFIVSNLDQSIPSKLMKRMVESIFIDYVEAFNVSTFVMSNGNYAAKVQLSSIQDAQYAISKANNRYISNKQILITHEPRIIESHHQQIKLLIILLLQESPEHKLPLFEFVKIFKNRFFISITKIHLFRMNDVCIVIEHGIDKSVSLNPEHKNTSLPFIKNIPEIEQIELPYCKIHNKKPGTYEYWSEKKNIPLPNVTMSLEMLEKRIHQLLKSHNGSLPVPSIIDCYEEEFHEPINIDDNGVPMEHLISCLPSIKFCQRVTGVNFLVWANSELIDDNDYETPISPKLINQISLFRRRVVTLLKNKPNCQLKLSNLKDTYKDYYCYESFKLNNYGFTKLIDLIDTFKQTIHIMGSGNQRTITLTHHAQAQFFTSDLIHILNSQESKQITLSEFPIAYEKIMGKPFNITDYGVCRITDILNKVPQVFVIITNINDNDKLMTLSKREQTPEKIDKTIELSTQVVELLGLTPKCNMLLNEFTSSYYQHFSREFRVDDYGFTTLIELFEAIPDVVNIEDTNDGKKIINLTEKEKWNSLKKQVVELIAKTNGGIYVPKLPHTILHDYKYMISPKKFSFKSVFIY